jgi:hypothetical protein
MGHATAHHHTPLARWGLTLIVLAAVIAVVLLAVQLGSGPGPATEAPAAEASTVTRPLTSTPCGLPPAVARAEGLDPRSCATPRDALRTTGPR